MEKENQTYKTRKKEIKEIHESTEVESGVSLAIAADTIELNNNSGKFTRKLLCIYLIRH